METPLQKLIEWISNERDRLAEFNEPVTAYSIQSKATELLPYEKQVMGECFGAGNNREWGESFNKNNPEDIIELTSPDFETYYNNTFNKQP